MLDYSLLHDFRHVCAFLLPYLVYFGFHVVGFGFQCFLFILEFDPFRSKKICFFFFVFNMFFFLACFRVKPKLWVQFMVKSKISRQPDRVKIGLKV